MACRIGPTDGDGTFSIVLLCPKNNKWSLTFKIGQSTYNRPCFATGAAKHPGPGRVLHFHSTKNQFTPV